MKAKFPCTGLIYRIHCNVTQEDYYGSTTTTLTERMHNHTSDKNSCRSRHIIKRGNYTVEAVETLTVDSEQQLLDLEATYIKGNRCINRNLPRQSLYCQRCNERIRDVGTHERSLKHKNKDTRTRAELFREIDEKISAVALSTINTSTIKLHKLIDDILKTN